MKRIIKDTAAFRSKYGFTLLEVVLAIAIMLVLTTMMMNGFAATMSYSYHTSIYSQTAATNYRSAMANIAGKSADPDTSYTTIDATGAAGDTIQLTMSSATFPSSRTMNVRRYMYNKGTEGIAQYGYRSEVENYTGATGAATDTDDGTYSNNRITFFYIPKVNIHGAQESTRGKIVVRRIKTGTTFKYYWYDTVNGTTLGEVT